MVDAVEFEKCDPSGEPCAACRVVDFMRGRLDSKRAVVAGTFAQHGYSHQSCSCVFCAQ